MDKRDYKLNIFYPIVIFVSLLFCAVAFFVYFQRMEDINKEKRLTVSSFEMMFQKEVDVEAAKLKGLMHLFLKDEEILNAFEAKDRGKLISLAGEDYLKLNQDVGLTHLYFIDIDGTILLRLHDTVKWGDIADRYTFKMAKQSGDIFYGLEFGIKNNFTLRVVQPVFRDGVLIGFLEFGKEVDKIIETLSFLLKSEIFIAALGDIYKSDKKYESLYKVDNYLIAYATTSIPNELREHFDTKNRGMNLITHEGRYYHLFTLPLKDISQKELGYYIFLVDATSERQIAIQASAALGIVLLILVVVIAVIARYYIIKKEDEIHNLDNEIEYQRDELKELNENLLRRVEEGIEERIGLEREKMVQREMLLQQSKMATSGEMMNAVIHQWKQPINAISLLSQSIEEELDEDCSRDEIRRSCKDIIGQIWFMSETMDDFRTFFKPTKEKTVFRACESFAKVIKMFDKQFKKEGIEITVHPHTHFDTCGYPSEFKHVVLNLLNNAKDAFLERGIKNGRIDINFEIVDGFGICYIRDNAGGIPKDVIGSIFEPYVSTKGEGGTGIGLYIAKTIIKDKMGGDIEVKNIENGAEFTIKLPIEKYEALKDESN